MAKVDVEALERQFNAALEEADTGSALDAARRIYAEYRRGGVDAFASALHPDYELHMDTLFFLDGRVYRGVEGFKRWRSEMEELWEEDNFEPQGVRFGTDDRFVVLGRLRVKGRGSGVEIDQPHAHLLERRGGKIVKQTMYSDLGAALRDAGIED